MSEETKEPEKPPVTVTTEGRQTGWWVIAEAGTAYKEWGPYEMKKALRLHRALVRKFRADGRMR